MKGTEATIRPCDVILKYSINSGAALIKWAINPVNIPSLITSSGSERRSPESGIAWSRETSAAGQPRTCRAVDKRIKAAILKSGHPRQGLTRSSTKDDVCWSARIKRSSVFNKEASEYIFSYILKKVLCQQRN